jgi:pimeloyl-ACP methyl ester carboxylesterase
MASDDTASSTPLAPGVLRTADERFARLPGFAYAPRYLVHDGLRVHYLDEGPPDAPVVALCLHGNPTWSYLYRHMAAVFLAHGMRVVAPDLIGLGRSDKPIDPAWHTFDRHRAMLLACVERLDLRNVMLVVQDWGGLLGLTLPLDAPQRYTRLLAMNTALPLGMLTDGFRRWRDYSNAQTDLPVGALLRRGKPDLSDAEVAGYDAPFPDARHKAALRAFPNLVPDGPHAPGAALGRAAQAYWSQHWSGASFMAVGCQDPVLGVEPMRALRATIRHCPEALEVAGGGHFLQEWGGPVAEAALASFGLNS